MSKTFSRRVILGWSGATLALLGRELVLPKWSHAALFGFTQAVPGYVLSFPKDHAAHPDYQTEWWYYTGHLRASTGMTYGYQLTFFRHRLDRPGLSLNPSRWSAETVFMAHLAITEKQAGRFLFGEKLNRAALGLAGAAQERYHVWNEDWLAERLGSVHHLVGDMEGMKLNLVVRPLKPPVLHGVHGDGLSQKGEGRGHASYYYSLTRLQTEGVLHTKNGVVDVEGISWMDHEFGSSQLTPSQVGWDWFSVQLDNNVELMLYLIRHQDGKLDPYSSGTLVYPDGRREHLRLEMVQLKADGQWRSPRSGATYPQGWNLQVAHRDIELRLEPVMAAQELVTDNSTRVTYWEGCVEVQGRFQGQTIRGAGYVELTGYAQRVNL